jgi:hypothetical protein
MQTDSTDSRLRKTLEPPPFPRRYSVLSRLSRFSRRGWQWGGINPCQPELVKKRQRPAIHPAKQRFRTLRTLVWKSFRENFGKQPPDGGVNRRLFFARPTRKHASVASGGAKRRFFRAATGCFEAGHPSSAWKYRQSKARLPEVPKRSKPG